MLTKELILETIKNMPEEKFEQQFKKKLSNHIKSLVKAMLINEA